VSSPDAPERSNVVPTTGLFVVADSVRQYKLLQIRWIAQMYIEESINQYLPIEFVLKSGQESIFTPPIVEAHGNDFYVIDGKTRAFAHGATSSTLNCVVVKNVQSNLPRPPVRLSDVRVDRRKSSSERIPPNQFRHIESAVHSW
jgi:hypothetical protein